jgi:hypothetical protein
LIKGIYLHNERKIQIVGTKDYLKNKRKLREIIIHEICHDIVGKDESKTEAYRVFVQYCLENEEEEFLKKLKKEATTKNPYNLIKRIFDQRYKGRSYTSKVISNKDINLKVEIEKLKNLKSI